MTAGDHEKLFARKPAHDGARRRAHRWRSCTRCAATFTADDHWRAIAEMAFSALAAPLADRPSTLTDALLALDDCTDAVHEIAIIWPRMSDRTSAAPLFSVLRQTFLPNKALAGSAEGDDLASLARLAPFVDGKSALHGRATAYVCQRGHCQLPTNNAEILARQLAQSSPY